MSTVKKERYFASGLVGAILALWAASSFTYFSNSGNVVAPNAIAGKELSTATTAKVADETRLMMIMDQSQKRKIFLPLGNNSFNIPGSSCNITDSNLSFYHEFKDIPENCFKVLGRN
jgi:hypothetical protein